jgi:glyoxylase-like metal-dependent hydrolase (beta-lactamase superfamily II)
MNFSIEKTVYLAFNSNTFIVKSTEDDSMCYLVDVGNAGAVLQQLKAHQSIKGIFLTHDHYDHICGLREIISQFPDCIIYCSQYTKLALADSKINLSFYHNDPITYLGDNCQVICEKDMVELFPKVFLETLETPGHNQGCLTFKLENVFFTGDSLIPHIAVVTKLKGGNKKEAVNSIRKLRKIINPTDVIYPGHGSEVLAQDVNWDFYF